MRQPATRCGIPVYRHRQQRADHLRTGWAPVRDGGRGTMLCVVCDEQVGKAKGRHRSLSWLVARRSPAGACWPDASAWPVSKMATMFGCDKAAPALASRSIRRRRPASSAKTGGRTLMDGRLKGSVPGRHSCRRPPPRQVTAVAGPRNQSTLGTSRRNPLLAHSLDRLL